MNERIILHLCVYIHLNSTNLHQTVQKLTDSKPNNPNANEKKKLNPYHSYKIDEPDFFFLDMYMN